jgi:hypothetical protein
MKKIVETTDACGLDALIGETVFLMCANYFYRGKMTGVNSTFVQLDDCEIIYNTDKAGKIIDRGSAPAKTWFVEKRMIESYGAA